MNRDVQKYLTETVFSQCARLGKFGPGMKFVRCDKDICVDSTFQFASSVVFVSIIVKDSDGTSGETKEQNIQLVIKSLPENSRVRERMNSMVQFYNESVAYSEILPLLEYNGIVSCLFPKCYFVDSSSVEISKAVVVVEDLREKHFKSSRFKIFLDYNHVILALEALGKFHALSYIAKQKRPDEFNKIVSKLREHVWDRGDVGAGGVIGPCSLRGVNALYNIIKSHTLKKLIANLKINSLKLMKYFVEPEEPIAVVCHGDFCNHNVFFKYDNNLTPDIPTAIKFYDLQTSRYASPVIDLSMILFLNTEYELRSCHWDEFIKVYHDSVSETVKSANCTPPTYKQLLNEFQNKSFYGYFQCSYFLPIMISNSLPQHLKDDHQHSLEDIIKVLCSNGGEKGTQSLVSIVKHLYELDYFGFLDQKKLNLE